MALFILPINCKNAFKQLNSRFLSSCFALILAVLAPSCMVIPIPTPAYNAEGARTNIDKEIPSQFEIGKTTRADLILALDEPDAVSSDELKLAYRSEKVPGWALILTPGGGGEEHILKDLYLVAEFDEKGMLQNFQSSHNWFGPDDRNEILPIIVAKNGNPVQLHYNALWFPVLRAIKTSVIGKE